MASELFKPGRHGFRPYQLADGFPEVSVDVVAADTEWCELAKPLWDQAEEVENADGKKKRELDGGALVEYHRLMKDFTRNVYQVPPETQISLAEAMECVAQLAKDAKEQVSFFLPPKVVAGAGDSSSPESIPDSLKESLMPAPASGT
jgi:hypothetical protein